MRIANELSIRAVPRPRSGDPPVSELLRDGIPTGERVAGAVLEAAVRHRDHYVLFMTDDVPFEDMLGIHLRNDHLEPIDRATLGGLYTTGSFSGLELIEPNRLRFRFLGETDWTLEILPRPVWRIPFFFEPAGVWRPLGLRRWFVLRGEPRPRTES